MAYFEDIDKHIRNRFDNYEDIKELNVLPKREDMHSLDRNAIYKVNYAAIAIDVVDFKKINEFTDKSILNVIMNELFYGVTKIFKEFGEPSKIQIQGDGMYGVFRINSKDDVDNIFDILCSLNTFKKNLQKRIDKHFPGELKKSYYSYNDVYFNFGIGASFSLDNYLSIVGHGKDTDLIFMGHAVVCANNLSKIAARNQQESILFDNLLHYNLTKAKKKRIEEIGGVNKIYNINNVFEEDIYGCNWVIVNYNNYVENNI